MSPRPAAPTRIAPTIDAPTPFPRPDTTEMTRAFLAHDASYDGVFLVAVRTTGVFCRPSCRPSRAAKRENVEFFPTVAACLAAGYRACRLCSPVLAPGAAPEWLAALVARVEADPTARIGEDELRAAGLSSEKVRRGFLAAYGVTFSAWRRGRRLAGAVASLREGLSTAEAAVDAGFESESGFRDAFEKAFAASPRDVARLAPVLVRRIVTPIGAFLAGASEHGIVRFEFLDRTRRSRPGEPPLLPGDSPHLDAIEREVREYFAGARRDFSVALRPAGTPFQRRVWDELRRIPHGATRSYLEVATAIGRPTATRAVARANGANPVAILIPCHRVVGADGSLTGYGGGLWRKRLLLELERTGRLPGA